MKELFYKDGDTYKPIGALSALYVPDKANQIIAFTIGTDKDGNSLIDWETAKIIYTYLKEQLNAHDFPNVVCKIKGTYLDVEGTEN